MFDEKDIQEQMKRLENLMQQESRQTMMRTKRKLKGDMELATIVECDVEQSIIMQRRKLPDSAKSNK